MPWARALHTQNSRKRSRIANSRIYPQPPRLTVYVRPVYRDTA